MSIECIAWVLGNSPTRRGERLVLISMAWHADADGSCWPSLDTVAQDAGISRRATITAVGNLARSGYIEVVKGGGKGRTNQYRVLRERPNSEATAPNSQTVKFETVKFATPNSEVCDDTVKLSTSNSEATSPDKSLINNRTVIDKSSTKHDRGKGEVASLIVPEPLEGFNRILGNSGIGGYSPSKDFLAKVLDKYRAIDLEEEAIKMTGWLGSKKGRGRSLSTAFILNWLSKATERSETNGAAFSHGAAGSQGDRGRAGTERQKGTDQVRTGATSPFARFSGT